MDIFAGILVGFAKEGNYSLNDLALCLNVSKTTTQTSNSFATDQTAFTLSNNISNAHQAMMSFILASYYMSSSSPE